MRLKRYVAPSMELALRQVREEMGDGALIVRTRPLRRWWLPWGARQVEVVAAYADTSEERRPAISTRIASPQPGTSRTQGAEARWFQRLAARDVEAGVAWDLIGRASHLAQSTGMDVDKAVAHAIARAVPVQPVWERGRHPRVVALVGPTGVGKTTTVAKLAANFSLAGGWSVGLISADAFRVGAVQHLRAYADLMGLSLLSVDGPERLRAAVQQLGEELILVDTTGHSPGDAPKLGQVLALLQALPEGSAVLLVVPATMRHADLRELVDAYRALPLTGVIVTKVDETARRGALVNAPLFSRLPLVYITTGQTVPDDIEAAEPEGVARWLLTGEEEGDRS